mmetsp:Transcript_15636/g.31761  ORF Transcript_15636/g.31761 Transcript_15636/m.31761 type:complete len:451 (-) Transcript_15636:1303-2655(-)
MGPPSKPPSSGTRNGNPHHPNNAKILVISHSTAWVLSFLVIMTFCLQMVLFIYHDDFLMKMNSLEKEISDEFSGVYNGAANTEQLMRSDSGLVLDRKNTYSMEPIDILKRAGVDTSSGFQRPVTGGEYRAAVKKKNPSLNQDVVLPSVEDIQALYGSEPRIVGLEQCEAFRAAVPPERRLMGPAGLFNSATNLLNKLLKLNCVNRARKQKPEYSRFIPTGMALQVPWGKHNPITWRLHHEAQLGGVVAGQQVPQTDVLPIVMIKDPITWMSSLCRHPYSARFRHRHLCPNLVPDEKDKGKRPGDKTINVIVRFATKHYGSDPLPGPTNKTFVDYDTILDFWSIWYKQYLDADFPRLMIRFEDLLFHAEETITEVCECGGGTMNSVFRYVEDSAKGQKGPHAGSAGFLASLITYGNRTLRMNETLTTHADVEYFRTHVDQDLMNIFSYSSL